MLGRHGLSASPGWPPRANTAGCVRESGESGESGEREKREREMGVRMGVGMGGWVSELSVGARIKRARNIKT